jgi:deazaflavin-dependent oxidoreductase (nitroreductase family)
MSNPADIMAFHAQRVAEFRANGGKLTPPLDTVPLLVLTTTGAKSGERRATPLSYSTDGDRFIVVAAAGGATRHPAWYHNLVANPEVTVEVGGETFRTRASVAPEPERARLFEQHAALRPNFAEFQRRTTRQLPVVILERLAAGMGESAAAPRTGHPLPGASGGPGGEGR